MLLSLHIENIAVIKCLDIDFSGGFTVFTGETGAGKSKIIDALGLAVGARFNRESIRSNEESAQVCALFSEVEGELGQALAGLGITPDEDGCIYVQRSLSADGKSIVRLNGRTVNASLHREVGSLLLGIHGQHDNHSLMSSETHIHILDKYSDNEALLSDYREYYNRMCEADRERSKLLIGEREKSRRVDMLSFQINDIESASVKEGEDEELENELRLLKNIKQLSKSVTTVYRALYKNEKGLSASRLIGIAKDAIDGIAETLPEVAGYSERLYDISYELEETARKIHALLPGAGDNPEARISDIEDRLDTIRKLKKKYGPGLKDVLSFAAKAKEELNGIMVSEELAGKYGKIYDENRIKAAGLARGLSKKRKKSAAELSAKITGELAYLDMKKVRFEVAVTNSDGEENGGDENAGALNANGADTVEFMISTNPGEPLRPLAKIASGGELSRIMLAVKCVLTGSEGIPTVIFDEIDTGVSGKTAQKIGIKLRQLATGPQVICITHSAQVAAMADSHLKIVKNEVDGRSSTAVVPLDRDGRVNEIARIMGGVNITDAILKSARELLEYKTEQK